MIFDIMLPVTLFLVTLATIFTFEKCEKKFKTLLEEKTLNIKDVILLVIVMGVIVTLMATIMIFIPQMAFVAVFLFAFSLLMFTFTYVISSKWHIAIIPPLTFLALYLTLSGIWFGENIVWELVLMNLYAVILAVMITAYIGSMFTWKTTMVFAVLLTLMDIVQVLYTRHMVIAAGHIVNLKLPMFIRTPTIPPIYYKESWVHLSLGVGDLFFAGLLTTQTLRRFGKKKAITTIVAISLVFFIFETFMLNYWLEGLPGTLPIILGWGIVNGILELQRAKR
jgi:presenilin-like A22 family membrane protease